MPTYVISAIGTFLAVLVAVYVEEDIFMAIGLAVIIATVALVARNTEG